jgi:4-hydroxybenzoate polyprenyltransferase
MVVASNGWFGWELLILGILAATFARNFAMGFNRFLDKDIDTLNPRTMNRPNADGRLSSRSIILFVITNGFFFVVTAYFINTAAFYLSFPILVILASYSAMKRFSWLAHLFLGLCLGLAPMAGSIAITQSIPLWAFLLSMGVMFWVAGFDLLYALQDEEFDKKQKLHSIPAHFGTLKTLMFSRIFHLMTIVCWLGYTLQSDRGIFGILALFASICFLAYEHYLVYKSLSNINKAFFTVNGYLGFIFLTLTCLDFIG